MSDLIKREDAIKAINARSNWYQVTCNGKQIAVMLMAKDVNEILEKVPSVDRPQEWIPCSERLPRPYTEVLVCDECGWVSLGSYRPCDVTEKDSGWSTLTSIKLPTDEVLAWMPLPEPWKGADDAI